MGRRVQLIRHTTGAADAFLGLQGELTVDTTVKEIRLHDGLSAGGIATAKKDLSTSPVATTSVAGKLSAADKQKLDWLGLTQAADLDQIEIDAAASKAVTDEITVTQAVDLDAIESESVANTAKLAGIESGATADQSDAEIRAAVEAATDSNVFTDNDHSKLNAIEASADVTDTDNVTAAGALMDSEVDANLKTFVLPASVTISAFIKTLLDDAAASNARSTLGAAAASHGHSDLDAGDVITGVFDIARIPTIDTANIAAAAIGRSQIANSTTTSAGSISGSTATNFNLNDWALFPMVHFSTIGGRMTGNSSDGGSAASPRFAIYATSTGTYDVDHRWIIAA